ncbi:MAG: hypothetical protein EOO92_13270 [Pedobacter sp.]|nr:MAG: hypothetical protein EOO92_13270 [Pedobacter sp.]
MGIIKGGILGGFRNKAGAVIGSYWRRLDIIKGIPRISGKAPSQKQIDQRAKFKLVTGFFAWISDLIDIGYKHLSEIDTPMNVAVSYHLKEAITGTSPNFTIDYSKVKFSQGSLKMPNSMSVISTTPGELDFTWVNFGSEGKKQDDSDTLTILVFCPSLFEFVSIRNVATRSAQAYTLSLPVELSGEEVHVYVSFNSVRVPELVSSSRHMGLISVL